MIRVDSCTGQAGYSSRAAFHRLKIKQKLINDSKAVVLEIWFLVVFSHLFVLLSQKSSVLTIHLKSSNWSLLKVIYALDLSQDSLILDFEFGMFIF